MSYISYGKIKLLSGLAVLAVATSTPLMAHQHGSSGYGHSGSYNQMGMGMGSGYGSNSGYYSRPNYGYQRPQRPPMRPYYPPQRMQPYGYNRQPMPAYNYRAAPATQASETPGGDNHSSVAGGNNVSIQGMSFQPGNLTVKVGETVTWVNKDSAPHTVTSTGTGSGTVILASGTLNSGDSYSMTFDKPGVFDYYCKFHPGMRATITVQ